MYAPGYTASKCGDPNGVSSSMFFGLVIEISDRFQVVTSIRLAIRDDLC